MSMDKRRRHAKQASMQVATQNLPRSAGLPFYARLNQILDHHEFDDSSTVCASGSSLSRLRLCTVGADRLLSSRSSRSFLT
jgi:hypothetical protein